MMTGQEARIMFLYLGRRGSISDIAQSMVDGVESLDGASVSFLFSANNDVLFSRFRNREEVTFLSTFSHPVGAFVNVQNLLAGRQCLRQVVQSRKISVVIDLMPHVWAPLLLFPWSSFPARYLPIIHDARPHPGDLSGRILSYSQKRVLHNAGQVIALSAFVAGEIKNSHSTVDVKTLFHPEIELGWKKSSRPSYATRPARLLVIGRMLQYKGLDVLLESIEILRRRNYVFELGIFGEGADRVCRYIHPSIKCECRSYWVSNEELVEVMGRYDITLLPYIEASQSGVAALAFSAGMPSVSTPVGGLPEQLGYGKYGVLSRTALASDFADAVESLLVNVERYQEISINISRDLGMRDAFAFAEALVDHIRK